jgi:8-oxo-dGTP pyrophosphatase MutT (NUDIX family)
VTGKVEPEDAGFAEAALRELEEETGILPMHALVDLDHEFRFLKQEAPVSERLMAAEVAPSARATLSAEHDQARWLPPEAALDLLSWDIHREGVRRVLDRVTGPGRSTA